MRTSERLGSGFSPNVSTTVAGDCCTEEPSAGSELTRLAWASAVATGPARRTPTANVRAASTRDAVSSFDLVVISSQQIDDDEHDDPDGVHEVPVAVSYTHLRAHETRHDLVCRLLLEKKKTKS